MTEPRLILGDCVEAMRELPDASIDAVVTDPPYSIEFMGRAWDRHEGEDAGFGYYLSGLIDGEGSFRIATGDRRCEFSLKLRDDDEWILRRARDFIGHGRVSHQRDREGSRPQSRLVVDSKDGVASLCRILLRYPLRAKKLRDFLTWAEAVEEWLSLERGNRWHGAADRARLAELGRRLREGRAYSEVAWSGSGFQDWTRQWAAEAYRVLKPGGHLLAFAGSRTYHRMACGVEDAGFEVRDCLVWMYGSGFPKSLDVAKAVDKARGVEGEYGDPKTPRHAEYLASGYGTGKHDGWDRPWMDDDEAVARTAREYLPGSEDGRRWKGWGTALKPAFEPIVLARKPLGGTVAANLLEHGVGAINVDGCRIAFRDSADENESKDKNRHGDFGIEQGGNAVYGDYSMLDSRANYDPPGRWPANVLLGHHPDCVELGTREVRGTGHTPASRPPSTFAANAQPDEAERSWRREVVPEYDCHPDCPVRLLDEQAGVSRSTGGAGAASGRIDNDAIYGAFSGRNAGASAGGFGDTGGPSRFFYTAKAGRAERNAGLDAFDERPLHWSSGDANPGSFQSEGTKREARNPHPTVKPVDLMRWLVRLVAPPGSLVLDPFLGSGTTGIACALEGVGLVGVERDPDYLAVAEARIRFWAEHGEDALRIVAERDAGEAARKAREDAGQLDLFA